MSENVSPIIDYYQKCNEDIRMEDNPLEYLRCKEIISRYLIKDHMDTIEFLGLWEQLHNDKFKGVEFDSF